MESHRRSLAELAELAMDIRHRYEAHERASYGRAWTRQEIALGFVGDVGDLAKLIQAAEGVRDLPDAEARLAHELADCLWSVLVLARMYPIDLEASFLGSMEGLAASLPAPGSPGKGDRRGAHGA